jgi:hypothetical protein
MRWHCPEEDNEIFDRVESFQDHMKANHSDTFELSDLDLLTRMAARLLDDMFLECSLCLNTIAKSPSTSNDQSQDFTTMPKHIASHLISLALMALPGIDNKEDEKSHAGPRLSISDYRLSAFTGSSSGRPSFVEYLPSVEFHKWGCSNRRCGRL